VSARVLVICNQGADFELPSLPVSLVYPEARLVSTRLRALVDWLKQTLGARPEIQ
jgi:DNA-binding transcriptional LysR family regulator